MSKQSSVDLIFNAFNLKSDLDFKAWMLNTQDAIKKMHKEEIINCMCIAFQDAVQMSNNENYKTPYENWEQYYNETFEK